MRSWIRGFAESNCQVVPAIASRLIEFPNEIWVCLVSTRQERACRNFNAFSHDSLQPCCCLPLSLNMHSEGRDG
jgi:hypothetical protein